MLLWFLVAVLAGAACTRLDRRAARVTVVTGLVVTLAAAAFVNGVATRGRPWLPANPDPELTAQLAQTTGRVAEYPLAGFDAGIGSYLARQMFHHRQLFNGSVPNTANATLSAIAADADDGQAGTALAVAGVTRVASHSGAQVPRGLQLVDRTASGVEVYDVPSVDRPAVAVLPDAFPCAPGASADDVRWVGGRGRLEVLSQRPGAYTVHLVMVAPPRTVTPVDVVGERVGTLDQVPAESTFCVTTRSTPEGVARYRTRMTTSAGLVRLGPSDPRSARFGVTSMYVTPGCAVG